MNKRESLILLSIGAFILFCILMGNFRVNYQASDGLVPAYADAATPTATATPTPTTSPNSTPTPIPKPVSLHIDYQLGSRVLGTIINKEDVKVTVEYSDGTTEETTEYAGLPNIIRLEGTNTFVLTYNGAIGYLDIAGKKLTGISAINARTTYSLGNGPDNSDLTVTASYSDGSFEEIENGYAIAPTIFNGLGEQTYTIIYQGYKAQLSATVINQPIVSALTVSYDGEVTVNEELDRSKLTVKAVYPDKSEERITTYILTTPMFTKEGENKINVTYKSQQATCTVKVNPRVAESIKAEYNGPSVVVGSFFKEEDLKVYVTYKGGYTEETKEFKIKSRYIKYNGDNTITVYVGDLSTTVDIQGIAARVPDFKYVSSTDIAVSKINISVTTALPGDMKPEDVEVTKLTQTKLKKIYKRNGGTGDYLGFKYVFPDEDNETYLPVQIRITLPDKFEPDYTDLFYSTNLKSIKGMLPKTKIDDHTLEFTIHKIGNYMIVHDPSAYLEEEEEDEDEDD